MKFLISLFWAFLFSFVSIFIITSILGDNGQTYTLDNCAILAGILAISATILQAVGFDTKQKEK